MRWRQISTILQAIFYIAAGVNHLWHPHFYLQIMPPYIPAHSFMVALSGWCEIAGGLGLLIPSTRKPAAYGLAAMLIVYFTVHIHMILHHADRYASIPLWLLYARLFFQPVLIAWALSARKTSDVRAARTATPIPQ